jgi:hypothetical protein
MNNGGIGCADEIFNDPGKVLPGLTSVVVPTMAKRD